MKLMLNSIATTGLSKVQYRLKAWVFEEFLNPVQKYLVHYLAQKYDFDVGYNDFYCEYDLSLLCGYKDHFNYIIAYNVI